MKRDISVLKVISISLCLVVMLSSAPTFLPNLANVVSAEESEEATAAEGSEETEGEKEKAEGENHSEGPPLDIREDLALWSLVVFILFVLVLKKLAWVPLNEALLARETGIRDNINDAEQARVKAEELLAEHQKQLAATQDQVQEIIAEAHRDADEVRQKLMAAAQREVEDLKNRTLEDMERAKSQAIKELFDTVSDQVALATEHVLGRALQNADQDRLIDDALAQLPDKG